MDGWRIGWPTVTDRRALVQTFIGFDGVRYTRVVRGWRREWLVVRPFLVILGIVALLLLLGVLQ